MKTAAERQREYRRLYPEKARESVRRYRSKNKERCLAITRAWRAAHVGRVVELMARWNAENKDLKSEYMKNRYFRARFEAIEAYGGKCRCCGEARWQFLAFDHVNDDGHVDRKNGLSSGNGLCRRLKLEGYPSRFQLLCHNCNIAKFKYHGCPHGNCWNSIVAGS